MKIVIGFYQVIFGMIEAFAFIKWPESLTFIGKYSDMLQPNVLQNAPIHCLFANLKVDAFGRLYAILSINAAVIIFGFAFYGIRKVLRANVSIDQTKSKNRGKPQKIDFAQTLYFGRAISPKSCYAVGFLKYRVIIENCANFDDPTEAAILTVNFSPTSADSHRQTMHSIALKTQTIVRMTFPLLFVSV